MTAIDVDAGGRADAARDDVAAFETLLRPQLTPALHLAQAMLRDRQEAEDAVQEAALKAWRAFDRAPGPEAMRAWFLTIVANHCRDRLRSRWWRVWRWANVDTGAEPGHEAGVVNRAQLRQALARLGSDQAAALYLRYQLDLPYHEIARILGVRVGTVRSRLHRALTRLRTTIEEEDASDAQ